MVMLAAGLPGAHPARVLRPESRYQQDGVRSYGGQRTGPKEDGPRPSGTFRDGRWDGHPLPADGPADSHGGAARNAMWSRHSTPWQYDLKRMETMASKLRDQKSV